VEKMISYDKFNHYMTKLQEFEDIENDIDKALNRLSPDFGGFFLGEIKNEYLSMLKELTHDKYNDIAYFIYDLEYGSKWKVGTITTKDGKDIKLSTIKDLYDYLKEQYND